MMPSRTVSEKESSLRRFRPSVWVFDGEARRAGQDDLANVLAGLFLQVRPLEVDIGCGKGKFLLARAQECGDRNFLGVDLAAKWMKVGWQRSCKRNLSNLKFVRADAMDLLEAAPPAWATAFHVYFPDPWPKRRHHKRRLVTVPFLELLFTRLVPQGYVHLATDDLDYFTEMKKAVGACSCPWNSVRESVNQRLVESAKRTNYELKYENRGLPLYYLELRKG